MVELMKPTPKDVNVKFSGKWFYHTRSKLDGVFSQDGVI